VILGGQSQISEIAWRLVASWSRIHNDGLVNIHKHGVPLGFVVLREIPCLNRMVLSSELDTHIVSNVT